MAISSGLSKIFPLCFIITTLILILSSATNGVAASGVHDRHLFGFVQVPNPARSGCRGTVGDCLAGDEDEEFQMDSEVSRRILASSGYISYGALQRNSVPCSQRGSSYYNCRSGGQANPYSRGCSAITRCRS